MFFRKFTFGQARRATDFFRPFAFTMCSGYWLHRAEIQHNAVRQLQKTILPVVQETLSQTLNIPHLTFIEKARECILKAWRILQLVFYFSPTVLMFPLRFINDWGEDVWLNSLVQSVERAGVVFIKSFQYLSHRRDIIGEKMASKFLYLRENAPQHPFSQTKRIIKESFGKSIQDIFEEFDTVPIASGSISQVYKAQYYGKKVAVKVRHPNVDANIQRDIDILFGASKLLSHIHGIFDIPITRESLKKTLTDQIDLRIEANNLNLFRKNFAGSEEVRFPKTLDSTCGDAVLVEDFIEGRSVSYYEDNKHQMNKAIARIGAIMFFEMLMKNNFIHADCHGGNIMVQMENYTVSAVDKVMHTFYKMYRWVENKLVQMSDYSELIKDLVMENKIQQDEVKDLEMQLGKKVGITMIDAGIVISLDEVDKINFTNFLKCLIKKEPDECAKLIYALSIHQGKKLVEQHNYYNQKYYQDLKELFVRMTSVKLKDMQGLQVLSGMLEIIRSYRMRLDGQFATILTNMLVLEQIARDLNPDMNIMKCAVYYFKDEWVKHKGHEQQLVPAGNLI